MVRFLLIFLKIKSGYLLDNGLALTPPMGWMSWQRFKCNTNCITHPSHCLSEKLIERIVKAMKRDGFLSVGYNYVSIDDCWLNHQRDSMGNLIPDPIRFPNGIKYLSNFIHSHGFKFGIYGAVGQKTCMNFPGNANHIDRDAKQYAEWGVDMFKFDGCFVPLDYLEPSYISMSHHLNKTGRQIAYLCSWPYYLLLAHQKPSWGKIKHYCNMWRVADDVNESKQSILNIIYSYELLQGEIAHLSGPGSWNDADQLLIGNVGMDKETSRIQMAMWAILASPLFISVDFDEINQWSKDLLMNKHIIEVNQDPLGIQGVKIDSPFKDIGIWVKRLVNKRLAVAFLCSKDSTISGAEVLIPLSIFFPYLLKFKSKIKKS